VNRNGQIRILLVDEHKIMREGLKALFDNYISSQNGSCHFKIVGEADNSQTAGSLAHELLPDVITIGVNISGSDGFETIRKLSKEFPSAKIIAHSMYIEKNFIREMLKAGSTAYVLKEYNFGELLKAIDAAVHNQVYLCPKAADIVMNGYLKNLAHNGHRSETALSDRQREVLKLLADGKSSKQMALELHISTKTIDTHRRQIMNKLKLYTAPELTKFAIRCGLTSLN
jgi:DNA-binding NarL/FixJ family response regulator